MLFYIINKSRLEVSHKFPEKMTVITRNQKKNLANQMITQNMSIGQYYTEVLNDEKANIASRPRRNIPRVDYTGMDTIEPESEYDGITDIWYDKTIYCDPDYIFEEDEEDEDVEDEEEQEEDDDVEEVVEDDDVEEQDDDDEDKWTKIYPEYLSNEYLSLPWRQGVRLRHKMYPVNYAGMDASDDENDEDYLP